MLLATKSKAGTGRQAGQSDQAQKHKGLLQFNLTGIEVK